MADFYTEVIRASSLYESPSQQRSPLLLEPVTRRKVQAIVSDVRGHGVSCVLFETYRSQQRQQELFHTGATELGHVGVHHYGLAADIVLLDKNGEPTWDDGLPGYALIGKAAHAHGLIWGGDWGYPDRSHSFRDFPHVQRCTVADQGRLFAGSWYPESLYDPYQHL